MRRALVVVALSTAVWIPTPAHAATSCVSKAEFSSAPWTNRAALENYWGTGSGRSPGVTRWSNPNLYNVDYPACAGDSYFVSVGYRKTTNQAIEMMGFFPN